MIRKIISGGQTGADMGGLLAARELGIETGGWAPKWWITEDGSKPELSEYGLLECPVKGYPARTRANVQHSDATVIFSDDLDSRGTRLTIRLCEDSNKPYLINPSPFALANFLAAFKIEVLNVAGNRESKSKGIEQCTWETIVEGVRLIRRANDLISPSLDGDHADS